MTNRDVKPGPLTAGLRDKIAGIIVRKVLQEDYDDLVEGYLDEILLAADEIILLPAYAAVAQGYYDRLVEAPAASVSMGTSRKASEPEPQTALPGSVEVGK